MCLLIETKDERKFVTHQENFKNLIEFAKTFDAQIFLINNPNKKILNMEQLCKAFCNQNYKSQSEYRKVKKLFPNTQKTRKEILKEAQEIQSFIMETFAKGESLSLKELNDKYKNCNLTSSCLCQHMARVRSQMRKDGFDFIKIGAGNYKLKQQ